MRRTRKIEKVCNRSEHASLADDGKFNEMGIWMKHSVDAPDGIDASDGVYASVYDVL